MSRGGGALAGAGLVAALAIGGAALGLLGDRSAGSPAPADSGAAASVAAQDRLYAARTKGSPTAPIVVYEIADFQCPACRVFWKETLPALQREYVDQGKLRLVFVNLPIPETHRNATAAHQFAMCAAGQDRFWAAHDRLFDEQAVWARLDDPSAYFLNVAAELGFAGPALDACLGAESIKNLVLQERMDALRAGVTSTPTFIIQLGDDRGLFPGAAPIEAWRPVLDSLFRVAVGN